MRGHWIASGYFGAENGSALDADGWFDTGDIGTIAAAIGVPHPKWQERPFLLVVRRPERPVAGEELLDFLADRVAKWWLPEGVAFVSELPHTATGKLQKAVLRERYAQGEFRD